MMEKKRKRQITNIISRFPSAIIEVIFSKLPFFNLPSCRLVCKQWNNLILTGKFDPQFSNSNLFFPHYCREILCVDLHTKHWKGLSTVASFTFHPKLFSGTRSFSIINSCHGLLCIMIYKTRRNGGITGRRAFILNPMTNEYLKIPSSFHGRTESYHYGLGFSTKTKQYKIVRASIPFDMDGILIEIFAYGTTPEWTTVCFLHYVFLLEEFVYSNGGLYFIRKGKDSIIYRLDVEDEKLSEISSPKDLGQYFGIVDVNGTLYLTIYGNDHLFHVWKMREDSSWIREFVSGSVDKLGREFFRPIKVRKDGKILYIHGLEFVLYDPKSETKRISMDQDMELNKKVMDINFLTTLLRSVLQISSFNFSSLPNILAGNS